MSAATTTQGNEDLLNMLRSRWDDGAFSDIQVHIFDREYPLHRMVLCLSPFLDRLLHGDWKEMNNQVNMPTYNVSNLQGQVSTAVLVSMY